MDSGESAPYTMLRLKLGLRGSSQIKMISVQASTSFRELKESAGLKLGFQSTDELELFWDADCKVDEPDDACIGTLFRDGDRIMVAEDDGPAPQAGQAPLMLMPPEPAPQHRASSIDRSQPGHRDREEQELASDGLEGHGMHLSIISNTAHHRPLRHSTALPGLLSQYGPLDDSELMRAANGSLVPASCKLPLDSSKKCTCRKNKCLKLYCQCFASGTFCNGCACQDCSNTADNAHLVHQEMQRALLRNPSAFVAKVESLPTSFNS
eukprot:gene8664-34115_t